MDTLEFGQRLYNYRRSLRRTLRLGKVHSLTGIIGVVNITLGDDEVLPARHLGSYIPEVGDVVQVFVEGSDLLVLGSTKKLTEGGGEQRDFTTNPILSTELADAAIIEAKVANNAISTNKVLDGAIARVKIAEAAINEALIEAGAVTNTKIADGSITTPKITANSIVSSHIQSAQIEAFHIVAGSITGDRLTARTVTADKIATNTITSQEMVVGTITAASGIIANAAITNAKIANATINAEFKLQGQSVTIAEIKEPVRGATNGGVAGNQTITSGAGWVTLISRTFNLPSWIGTGYFLGNGTCNVTNANATTTSTIAQSRMVIGASAGHLASGRIQDGPNTSNIDRISLSPSQTRTIVSPGSSVVIEVQGSSAGGSAQYHTNISNIFVGTR